MIGVVQDTLLLCPYCSGQTDFLPCHIAHHRLRADDHYNRDIAITSPAQLLSLQPGADWGKKVARELLSDRPTQYTARGPLSTRRAAHSIAYTARCPFNASYVSTSQWPTWKNTHTLNIILDDYKEITSYMFFF